jgi:hypothetical protein
MSVSPLGLVHDPPCTAELPSMKDEGIGMPQLRPRLPTRCGISWAPTGRMTGDGWCDGLRSG